MIVLKIICLVITVITCVVNVIYLVNVTRTFSDRFYEKLGNYDDRKLEKYKNGLYDYSDNIRIVRMYILRCGFLGMVTTEKLQKQIKVKMNALLLRGVHFIKKL